MNAIIQCESCSSELRTYENVISRTNPPRFFIEPCQKCLGGFSSVEGLRKYFEEEIEDCSSAIQEAEDRADELNSRLSEVEVERNDLRESLDKIHEIITTA